VIGRGARAMVATTLAALALTLAGCGGKEAAPPPPPPLPAMAKPQPVSIKLRNHRAGPIWVAVPAACAGLPARLETKAGVQVPLDDVTPTCAEAASGPCAPAAACPARVIRIDGDSEVVVRWDGRVARPRTLAKAAAGCPTACVDRGGPPPATDYWLRATAWSACVGADCTCNAAAPADGCPQPASLTGAPDLQAATPIDIPSALGVTIMFE